MRRRHRHIERRQAFEIESGRRRYVMSSDHAEPDQIREVWNAALQILRPVLRSGKVDLFPNSSGGDLFDSLPEAARDGWRTINDRVGSASGMGVWVDLVDEELFDAFRAFGLSSIHCLAYPAPLSGNEKGTIVIGGSSAAVVFRRDPRYPLVYNHDQGGDVSLEMTEAEVAELRAVLDELGVSTDTLIGPVPAEDTRDV